MRRNKKMKKATDNPNDNASLALCNMVSSGIPHDDAKRALLLGKRPEHTSETALVAAYAELTPPPPPAPSQPGAD